MNEIIYTPLRLDAALYRIEASMHISDEDAPIVAHAYRILQARIEALETALTNLLHLAEQDEIQIEEEWGDGTTLEEMEAAGELAKEIVLARAVLAAEEKKP